MDYLFSIPGVISTGSVEKSQPAKNKSSISLFKADASVFNLRSLKAAGR
jgi:hypothetical protein